MPPGHLRVADLELAVDVTGDVGPGPLLTDALKLPDGTPLLQAGEADPTAQDRGVASARCAMVDSATANAVLAQLPPKAPGNAGSWDFANATVIMEPTLPGAQSPLNRGPAATSFPRRSRSTTALSGTDACAFASPDAAQQVLGHPSWRRARRRGSMLARWVERVHLRKRVHEPRDGRACWTAQPGGQPAGGSAGGPGRPGGGARARPLRFRDHDRGRDRGTPRSSPMGAIPRPTSSAGTRRSRSPWSRTSSSWNGRAARRTTCSPWQPR